MTAIRASRPRRLKSSTLDRYRGKILEMYFREDSLRDMATQLYELTGMQVAPSTISRRLRRWFAL